MGSISFTTRDFHSQQSRIFDLADRGETVIIRRYKKSYAIVPVEDETKRVTSELQTKIDMARKELVDGKAATAYSHKELDDYLNSL